VPRFRNYSQRSSRSNEPKRQQRPLSHFKSLDHWFLRNARATRCHRLARAAFALKPARHFAETPPTGRHRRNTVA